MRFYSFVMKNVGRRRVRSLLTILGMAIAVGAVVSLVGIATGFETPSWPSTSDRKWI